jgi:hypothetical protein
MKPHLPIALALLAMLSAATAGAQIGVYAGFSGGHDTAVSGAVYGPLVGAYVQKGGVLSLGADLRGSFLSHNGGQFYTGAVGPRIALKPAVLPIKPYLEGLVGIGHTGGGNASSSTHLNYQVLFGIDATILPRIDWRVIEYDYSALVGNSTSATILTTGIVFRLP